MASKAWTAACPLCGETISREGAVAHLASAHGMMLCGVSPDGLSYESVQELCGFYERLKARTSTTRSESDG